MTPIVDNERLYFEASGLYDGLVLLGDTKTRSYWNHITGECLYGDYEGKVLEINNLYHYTLEMALEEFTDLQVAVSKLPFPLNIGVKLFGLIMKKDKGFIPPFFRKTMTNNDHRQDENDIGIGVVIDGRAKFYNIKEVIEAKVLRDQFAGQDLQITFDEGTRIPRCVIEGTEKLPMQLYTRWYGFSYTYKNCDLYEK